jgi:prevent-host-death family protein
MAKEVALREANQQFAKYVRAVEAGESFVITRRGKPVARLAPIEPGKRVDA